jgi:hypothetical protein
MAIGAPTYSGCVISGRNFRSIGIFSFKVVVKTTEVTSLKCTLELKKKSFTVPNVH